MNEPPSTKPPPPGPETALALLFLLGLLSAVGYAVATFLSFQFDHESLPADRPIPAFLGLFACLFIAYLASLMVAVRAADDRRLLWVIVVGAVLFRFTVLSSTPIQEVDIYRYLWDGAVSTEGVSPFRYSPQQVSTDLDPDVLPPDLRRLTNLRDASPPLATALERVHYGHLPTIYPPVAQAVFAAAAWLTPVDASVAARMTILKTLFVGFDLATLALVVGLLRFSGRHVGWSIAYGWCPLLMKEVANSGHLDTVPVFLTTAAVYVAVTRLFRRETASSGIGWAIASAVLLALGVGAKLYPVVLIPLFFGLWIRRLGAKSAVAATLVFVVASAAVLWPMLPHRQPPAPLPSPQAVTVDVPPPVEEPLAAAAPSAAPAAPSTDELPASAPPFDPAATAPQNASAGLAAFLREWEMNDFLFLITIENIRPLAGVPPEERPWFAVVPENWRVAAVQTLAGRWPIDERQASFFLSRAITGGVFLLVALGLAMWGVRADEPAVWLEAAFLTLAWFWLLSPTQNPWYWTWALPLLPFARSRAWLALSGLSLVYYLRFWLIYHWPDAIVWPLGYRGELAFDFVVTWWEFAPWFLWLAAEYAWRRFRT